LSSATTARRVLGQIWVNMTQLESLDLFADIKAKEAMKLDSLITGIPIEGLNQIRQVIPDLEKMTVENRREEILSLVEEHGTQPSILNLTNLRHLKLRLSAEVEMAETEPMYNVSDLTGYLGIYLMKQLKHLEIENCNFTKKCCEILTMETGVEAWSFESEESEHIIPPFQIP